MTLGQILVGATAGLLVSCGGGGDVRRGCAAVGERLYATVGAAGAACVLSVVALDALYLKSGAFALDRGDAPRTAGPTTPGGGLDAALSLNAPLLSSPAGPGPRPPPLTPGPALALLQPTGVLASPRRSS